jgi:hypothetical protein
MRYAYFAASVFTAVIFTSTGTGQSPGNLPSLSETVSYIQSHNDSGEIGTIIIAGQDVEYGSPSRESISISADSAAMTVEWRNDSSGDATRDSVPIEPLLSSNVTEIGDAVVLDFPNGFPVSHVEVYGSKQSAKRSKSRGPRPEISFLVIAHSQSPDERERLCRAAVHLIALADAQNKAKHAADNDPFK